jgi:thiopurine S-methyltransferase
MEPQFWHERWALNEIGFHQVQFNPLLTQFWKAVSSAATPGTVFVPLCGKTLDMVWLQEQGHPVLGVELSSVAIEDFFKERSLPVLGRPYDDFIRFENNGFQLLAGDFFDLKPAHLNPVQAVYDRAALIALPEQLQARYVSHLLDLLPTRPPILLITLEYEPTEMTGPPFSIGEERVADLFGGAYTISRLAARDVLDEHAGLKSRGLTGLTEKAYHLKIGR